MDNMITPLDRINEAKAALDSAYETGEGIDEARADFCNAYRDNALDLEDEQRQKYIEVIETESEEIQYVMRVNNDAEHLKRINESLQTLDDGYEYDNVVQEVVRRNQFISTYTEEAQYISEEERRNYESDDVAELVGDNVVKDINHHIQADQALDDAKFKYEQAANAENHEEVEPAARQELIDTYTQYAPELNAKERDDYADSLAIDVLYEYNQAYHDRHERVEQALADYEMAERAVDGKPDYNLLAYKHDEGYKEAENELLATYAVDGETFTQTEREEITNGLRVINNKEVKDFINAANEDIAAGREPNLQKFMENRKSGYEAVKAGLDQYGDALEAYHKSVDEAEAAYPSKDDARREIAIAEAGQKFYREEDAVRTIVSENRLSMTTDQLNEVCQDERLNKWPDNMVKKDLTEGVAVNENYSPAMNAIRDGLAEAQANDLWALHKGETDDVYDSNMREVKNIVRVNYKNLTEYEKKELTKYPVVQEYNLDVRAKLDERITELADAYVNKVRANKALKVNPESEEVQHWAADARENHVKKEEELKAAYTENADKLTEYERQQYKQFGEHYSKLHEAETHPPISAVITTVNNEIAEKEDRAEEQQQEQAALERNIARRERAIEKYHEARFKDFDKIISNVNSASSKIETIQADKMWREGNEIYDGGREDKAIDEIKEKYNYAMAEFNRRYPDESRFLSEKEREDIYEKAPEVLKAKIRKTNEYWKENQYVNEDKKSMKELMNAVKDVEKNKSLDVLAVKYNKYKNKLSAQEKEIIMDRAERAFKSQRHYDRIPGGAKNPDFDAKEFIKKANYNEICDYREQRKEQSPSIIDRLNKLKEKIHDTKQKLIGRPETAYDKANHAADRLGEDKDIEKFIEAYHKHKGNLSEEQRAEILITAGKKLQGDGEIQTPDYAKDKTFDLKELVENGNMKQLKKYHESRNKAIDEAFKKEAGKMKMSKMREESPKMKMSELPDKVEEPKTEAGKKADALLNTYQTAAGKYNKESDEKKFSDQYKDVCRSRNELAKYLKEHKNKMSAMEYRKINTAALKACKETKTVTERTTTVSKMKQQALAAITKAKTVVKSMSENKSMSR